MSIQSNGGATRFVVAVGRIPWEVDDVVLIYSLQKVWLPIPTSLQHDTCALQANDRSSNYL